MTRRFSDVVKAAIHNRRQYRKFNIRFLSLWKTDNAKIKIPVRIHLSHAQSGWMPLLNRVMRELELEDIDGIYEELDGAPVARIASLVDGGLYFARPTEVLAVLRKVNCPRRRPLDLFF